VVTLQLAVVAISCSKSIGRVHAATVAHSSSRSSCAACALIACSQCTRSSLKLHAAAASSPRLCAAAPTLAPTTAAPTTAAPSTAKPTTAAPVTAKPTTATVAVKLSGPYNGVASQIPGTVSADWFDTGGPGVAYSGMQRYNHYSAAQCLHTLVWMTCIVGAPGMQLCMLSRIFF
jgi:hypothetical protein